MTLPVLSTSEPLTHSQGLLSLIYHIALGPHTLCLPLLPKPPPDLAPRCPVSHGASALWMHSFCCGSTAPFLTFLKPCSNATSSTRPPWLPCSKLSVKSLPCKHEHLSSISRPSLKTNKPSTTSLAICKKQRQAGPCCLLANQPELGEFWVRERPCLKLKVDSA